MTSVPATPAEPDTTRAAFSDAMSDRDVLALHEVSKKWGELQVLDAIDLVLAAGTVTWIGGTNGVGKTTLLRIAAGLIGAEGGVVWLDGLHPERQRRAYLGRVGFLSAGDRGLYARMSVKKHLDFAARIAFVPRGERRARIEESLERFLLQDLADRRVDRMSMGQRQRLRIAMTLIHGPDVLLFDEPANSLDEPGIEMLRGVVDDTVSVGGVVLWCSPGGLQQPVDFDDRYTLSGGALSRA